MGSGVVGSVLSDSRLFPHGLTTLMGGFQILELVVVPVAGMLYFYKHAKRSL